MGLVRDDGDQRILYLDCGVVGAGHRRLPIFSGGRPAATAACRKRGPPPADKVSFWPDLARYVTPCHWVSLSSTESHRWLPCFTTFHRVFLGLIRFYWQVLLPAGLGGSCWWFFRRRFCLLEQVAERKSFNASLQL